MENLATLIFLMFAAVLLVGIAQKLRIPYPIILVAGGAVLGFIPGIQAIYFNPNLLLTTVLPPILYYAAFGIAFSEFKANIREIFSLALGLVIASTLVIGLIFKWLFPDYPWALAFAFGAIVSPPDAAASVSILRNFSMSSRLQTILEGESLINDASALVLYKLAVIALLSGAFSISEATFELTQVVFGGILIGIFSGYFLQLFSRYYLDPIVGVVFSFIIPYIVYIFADSSGSSGVLAVVVNGLIASRIIISHRSSLRRVLGYVVWDFLIILLNCFVFILIGTQLRSILEQMPWDKIFLNTIYGFLITLILIVIRLIWVYFKYGISYMVLRFQSGKEAQCLQILKETAIIGWSGMRGIVSLSAALALPILSQSGEVIKGREEVILITFVVIFLTLIIPGLTLSILINRLNIQPFSLEPTLQSMRKILLKAAEDEINRLYHEKKIILEDQTFLIHYFHSRNRILEITAKKNSPIHTLEFARIQALQSQRELLFGLWEQKKIDDRLLVLLEREIDLEETQLNRAELNYNHRDH